MLLTGGVTMATNEELERVAESIFPTILHDWCECDIKHAKGAARIAFDAAELFIRERDARRESGTVNLCSGMSPSKSSTEVKK
jgi:hypothetical protein